MEVGGILSDLLRGARAALGQRFIGMYLHGSLALGDFDPASSDIDFVVVTDREPGHSELAALEALHAGLALRHPYWARQLEGSYIPQADLRRYDPACADHPHIYEGRFFVEPHGVHWVIERYVLRKCGVVLAGLAPEILIDPIAPEELRRAVIDLTCAWWAPMVEDPVRLYDRAYRIYAVMTMCRTHYTLEHADVVSKPMAARWARSVLGSRWQQLIDEGIPDVDEVRAFIGSTVDRCRQAMPATRRTTSGARD